MYFHFAEPYKLGRKIQHLDFCHDFKVGLSKISIYDYCVCVYIHVLNMNGIYI